MLSNELEGMTESECANGRRNRECNGRAKIRNEEDKQERGKHDVIRQEIMMFQTIFTDHLTEIVGVEK